MDSPALTIQKQQQTDKRNLNPGIYNFKINGIKRELNLSSITLSSAKYIQLPKLLYQITWEAMQG